MANNRRKSAAVALAVLGVAGLSLAAASQLNFDPTSGVLQAGVKNLTDCQSGNITVKAAAGAYSAAVPGFQASTVTLSGISSTCVGKNISVQALGSSNAALGSTVSSVIPAAVSPATTSVVTLTLPAGTSATAVYGVAAVISD